MSDRCHDRRLAEMVGEALRLIPARLRPLVGCDVILGVDPGFAGIHHYDVTEGGHRYAETAHTVYPHHLQHRPAEDRGPKIILPTIQGYKGWHGVWTVVHELGHVLDFRTGFSHGADPVSSYARTNRYEGFAEAFAVWVWGQRVDDKTAALFRGIAA